MAESNEEGLLDRGTQAKAEGAAEPDQSYGVWESFNIRMESGLAQYLCTLGGGDLSEGIMIAAKFHQASKPAG